MRLLSALLRCFVGRGSLRKHIRHDNLVPDVLRWKDDMEDSMKIRKSKRKDYAPMFPSKGGLSENMSVIGSDSETDINLGSEDGCVKDEESQLTDFDPWFSSPHMDQLSNQLNSNCHSSQMFSPTRGNRVQGKGMSTFDMDLVNTFLSIFLAKWKLNLACILFEIFYDIGVNPVNYSYNSMTSSLVKKGYFNQAWGVLNEVGEKVCPADKATYNVIIQVLGKMGRVDLARAVDIVMYNTLNNELGKAGRIDEANKLFEQMRTTGINPDVITFNTLIEVQSKIGRLKEAYKLLKMMLNSDGSPNQVTDSTLDFFRRQIEKLKYQKESIMQNKDDSS